MFLLPHLAQRLCRGSFHLRPTTLHSADPLDPPEHLALEGGRPELGPFEPFEVLHADQRGLGATPRCEHDALATVGRIVDERGQTIAGLGQADLLHAPDIRH
jgi:hypothetical protein